MALPGFRRIAPLLLAAVFGGPLLLPAAGDGAVPDSRTRVDALRTALEAAADAAPDVKTRKAFLAAREILVAPGSGLESETTALGKASRILEKKAPGRTDLLLEVRLALGGCVDDAEWEYGSLDARIAELDAKAEPRLRDLVESRIDLARSLDPSRPSRAFKALRPALKALREIRFASYPNYGGALRVVSFDPPTGNIVGLNQPLSVRFSGALLPSSVRPDTFQVRIGPNFQVQAQGSLVVTGNTVRFHPRLPSNLDGSGGAFPPGTKIRVTTVGFPSTNHISSRGGGTLDRTLTAEVTTASPGGTLYDYLLFTDAPPPRLRETFPADVLPAAPYDGFGGALGVETTVEPVLRLARVPLDPTTLPGRVHLFVANLRGTPVLREVSGTPVLDQDHAEVLLSFRPSVELADDSVYFLRLDAGITDLSGQFEMEAHAGRTALSSAAAEELQAGGGPLSDFALAHPWAVDPRTFLVFSTGDEPPVDRLLVLRFDGTDPAADGGDGSDPAGTSASFDAAVPGAVAATVAAAGGDGHLGDFEPAVDTILDTSSPQAEAGVFQFRRIVIPAGVTVTLKGPLPAVLRASRGAAIDGTLRAAGGPGASSEANYSTTNLPTQAGGPPRARGGGGGAPHQGRGRPPPPPPRGGPAGPGGGGGGTNSMSMAYALPGDAGGSVPGGGGGGGGGLETGAGDTYSFPGGGGGGGHRTDGSAGSRGTWTPSSSAYNGAGGAGGPAGGEEPTSAATADGVDFSGTGGAGGGAGGNGHYTVYSWRTSGAGGGGGGGGVLVSTSGDLRIAGVLDARGGAGGNSSAVTGNYSSAPGGGGAGGAIALYASGAVDLSGGSLDVGGGPGGTPVGWAGAGGGGSAGWVRIETGSGEVAGLGSATLLPDYSTGIFDPAAGVADPPSVFTSAWFDLGALQPEILPFGPERFVEQEIPGCTISYEIQMAGVSAVDPTVPDTGSLDPLTGATSDPARASGWVVLKTTAGGILDPGPLLDGPGYRFLRLRITFTVAAGRRASDGLPFVDEVRIPFRVQGG